MTKWPPCSIRAVRHSWPSGFSHRGAFRSQHTARVLCIADILDLPADVHSPRIVNAYGFVQSIRKQKTKAFAAIGDGSSFKSLQAVLDPRQAESLSTGAAVSLKGNWVPSRNLNQQAAELQVSEAYLLGQNDASTYPIQKKFQTLEFLRDLPHLRSRLPYNALLLRLRSQMIGTASRFFEESGYVQTHPPVITSSDCEGAGEVFQVADQGKAARTGDEHEHFFSSPKYLTVSSQLHLEAMAQAVGKVWTLSPTFRAEKSDTARHLSEFYMLEAETYFVNSVEDIMKLVESLAKALTAKLVDSKLAEELEGWHQSHGDDNSNEVTEYVALRERWSHILTGQWPRITYHQAVQRLQETVNTGAVRFNATVDGHSGLQTEHERFIVKDVGRGGPLFVTDYPKAIKPFYMAPSAHTAAGLGSAETAACFDLLMPDVCEVAGGSMREHRLPVLEAAMKSKGLLGAARASASGSASQQHDGAEVREDRTAGLDWYLDLRRYGSAPHGGFGMGFDRLLAYLAGVKNIRDTATFPRWYGRCAC